MATASVASVPTYTLTLSEDEAQVLLALTGKVGSNDATESIYGALNDTLGYPYTSKYRVNSNTYGDEASTLHLVKR